MIHYVLVTKFVYEEEDEEIHSDILIPLWDIFRSEHSPPHQTEDSILGNPTAVRC